MVVHQFPPVEGQDSLSPFCTKAQRCLAARGLPFEVRHTLDDRQVRRLNPGVSKLPVLELDDGRRIADSTNIARWADSVGQGPTLMPSDPVVARQVAWLEDWSDEALLWFLPYHRWGMDDGFRRFRDALLPDLPRPVRLVVGWQARRRIRRDLHGQGLGRLAPEVVGDLLDGHLDRIDAQVGDGWLVGDTLTVADIAVFSVLQGLHSPLLPGCRARIAARPRLKAWAERVDARTTAPSTVAWA